MTDTFSSLPTEAKNTIPFTVAIPTDEVDEFKKLVQLSRIARPNYENTQEDRHYGVTTEWLAGAKKHWLEKFDWRACEARINSFPNYKAQIEDDGEDFQIHFTALFSKRPDAIPVISVHGWPGSFLEFLPMLDLVSKQYNPETLPYHLIIPSLPGYGFSSKPPLHKNFNVIDATRILHKLMIHLGFSAGYVVTGGDVGSGVARIMAAQYEECKAMQINFCLMGPPASVAQDTLSAFDQECLQRGAEFERTGAAYAIEHGTRPATIGLVLAANPISLLAWIGEKFLTWSDEDPSLDVILESVSLWWFTETMPTSCYPYRMRFEGTRQGHEHLYIRKPFGYSLFPKEVIPVPKSWAATTGDLSWFRQHDSGGHFAALEKPKEMKQDLEDFLKHVVEEKGVKFGS